MGGERMILLSPEERAALRDWFLPERPGPLIGMHVLQTGNGSCHVDRWPAPGAALFESAGNYTLRGDPAALTPADMAARLSGFVEAPGAFAPLLKTAFPDLVVWERVVLAFPPGRRPDSPQSGAIRRLEAADAYHLWSLSPEINWIAKTWGGPPGLAGSGCAWGAFVDGRLAAVANSFFVGESYEDIGVVTEPEFRGLGLSTACAGALCLDILARGRRPSWTTSTDNAASLRVAQKLGFVFEREDRLFVVGRSVP
jgi:RimJ/RimL family protein N-acetyltransferase